MSLIGWKNDSSNEHSCWFYTIFKHTSLLNSGSFIMMKDCATLFRSKIVVTCLCISLYLFAKFFFVMESRCQNLEIYYYFSLCYLCNMCKCCNCIAANSSVFGGRFPIFTVIFRLPFFYLFIPTFKKNLLRRKKILS